MRSEMFAAYVFIALLAAIYTRVIAVERKLDGKNPNYASLIAAVNVAAILGIAQVVRWITNH